MLTSDNDTIGVNDIKKGSATINEADQVVSFVATLIGVKGNSQTSDVHNFGMEDSMLYYEALKRLMTREYPDLWNELRNNITKQGSFCLDIGCGYMHVGRQIARDLGIKYVGMDIVNKSGSQMITGQEHFVAGDIFQALPNLPENSVPLILLNNFDPSTFYKSNTSLSMLLRQSDDLQLQSFQQCDRILMPGGYLIALGTTACLSNKDPFFKFFENYKDITEKYTTATILRKPPLEL